MAYYRKRNYRTSKKKYRYPGRALKMNCSVHGQLNGNSKDYHTSVYESLNDMENKVELKCFKCLDEKVGGNRAFHQSKYDEIEREAIKKYRSKASMLENVSALVLLGAFLLAFYLVTTWGWIEGLIPGILLFILGWMGYKQSRSLYEKYLAFMKEHAPTVSVVSSRSIVDSEKRKVQKWRAEQRRKLQEKIDFSFKEIDSMKGTQFENFVKQLLLKNGYENPQITKTSGDEGVDIITFKNNKKIAIQCKRYEAKVSNSAVQQVYSGKDFYDCDEAIVITNSTYTESAITLAKKHKVKLIDRVGLFEMMERAKDYSGETVKVKKSEQMSLFTD